MGNRTDQITWQQTDRYSPVQDRRGIRDEGLEEFPPAAERVTQHPDPFSPSAAGDREIMRVTYQGDDRCNLKCPGCYTKDRLTVPLSEIRGRGGRIRAPWQDFTGHMEALGEGLQDFYLLGAEPTIDPDGSAAKLAWAAERGMPLMACTNGACSVARFEQTFGDALDSGAFYKLSISLDSMTRQVHNELRGQPWAFDRTIEIIRHCVARGAPVNVQMTVWGLNYPTITDSARQLLDLGVRSLSFHSGTLEGSADPDGDGLVTVDPAAWRALAGQLLRIRDENRVRLDSFLVPWLYFTEAELRDHVIGDETLTGAYLEHAAKVEAGQPSAMPVHACPALDVPQVYLYGNGGLDWRGSLSACNLHKPPGGEAFAEYDPDRRQFTVIQDPARNQLAHMAASPHLCPATAESALRLDSDRIVTEAGDLYAACRYISSNQMPGDRARFGDALYADAAAYYRVVGRALRGAPGVAGPVPAMIRRVTEGIVSLADRAAALASALDAAAILA